MDFPTTKSTLGRSSSSLLVEAATGIPWKQESALLDSHLSFSDVPSSLYPVANASFHLKFAAPGREIHHCRHPCSPKMKPMTQELMPVTNSSIPSHGLVSRVIPTPRRRSPPELTAVIRRQISSNLKTDGWGPPVRLFVLSSGFISIR